MMVCRCRTRFHTYFILIQCTCLNCTFLSRFACLHPPCWAACACLRAAFFSSLRFFRAARSSGVSPSRPAFLGTSPGAPLGVASAAVDTLSLSLVLPDDGAADSPYATIQHSCIICTHKRTAVVACTKAENGDGMENAGVSASCRDKVQACEENMSQDVPAQV